MAEENRIKWTAGNAAEELGTFLLNDTLRTYDGSGYEHIQIDILRCLNYVSKAQAVQGRFACRIPIAQRSQPQL